MHSLRIWSGSPDTFAGSARAGSARHVFLANSTRASRAAAAALELPAQSRKLSSRRTRRRPARFAALPDRRSARSLPRARAANRRSGGAIPESRFPNAFSAGRSRQFRSGAGGHWISSAMRCCNGGSCCRRPVNVLACQPHLGLRQRRVRRLPLLAQDSKAAVSSRPAAGAPVRLLELADLRASAARFACLPVPVRQALNLVDDGVDFDAGCAGNFAGRGIRLGGGDGHFLRAQLVWACCRLAAIRFVRSARRLCADSAPHVLVQLVICLAFRNLVLASRIDVGPGRAVVAPPNTPPAG